MKDGQFTRQERTIIEWLKICTAFLFVYGFVVSFYPHTLLRYFNGVGQAFFNFLNPPIAEASFGYWWSGCVASTLISLVASFLARQNWLKNYTLIPMMILSKITTAVCLAVTMFLHPLQFYYLVTFAIEAVIGLMTWFYYAQARQSRPD